VNACSGAWARSRWASLRLRVLDHQFPGFPQASAPWPAQRRDPSGGDIDNLSCPSPRSRAGRGPCGRECAGSVGGGISARGRSILGGSYDVGPGQLSLIAGADVGDTRDPQRRHGRGGAIIASAMRVSRSRHAATCRWRNLHPTLLAQGIFQPSPRSRIFLDLWRGLLGEFDGGRGSVTLDDESIAVGTRSRAHFSRQWRAAFPPGGGACSTRCRPRSIWWRSAATSI